MGAWGGLSPPRLQFSGFSIVTGVTGTTNGSEVGFAGGQEGKTGGSSSTEKRGFALSRQSELWVRAEQTTLGAGDPGEVSITDKMQVINPSWNPRSRVEPQWARGGH